MALDQAQERPTDRAEPGKTNSQGRDHGLSGTSCGADAQRRFANGTTLCNFSGAGFKKAPQVAGGLADALLVLDQRDPHEAFAVFAKANAGRNRDLGLLDQQR